MDMLGRVAGVNVMAMASLAANSPETLDTLGLWDAPVREGFSRSPITIETIFTKAPAISVEWRIGIPARPFAEGWKIRRIRRSSAPSQYAPLFSDTL